MCVWVYAPHMLHVGSEARLQTITTDDTIGRSTRDLPAPSMIIIRLTWPNPIAQSTRLEEGRALAGEAAGGHPYLFTYARILLFWLLGAHLC